MPQELIWAIKPLLLPPGGLILLALLGLMLSRRFLGKFLILLSISGLYLFSTGFVAQQLALGLQEYPAQSPDQLRASGAEAIVVLGGGSYRDAPEYGEDTVSGQLLERLRYAAWLSRRLDLPVIPSGGSDLAMGRAEAESAREVLQQELGVRVIAVETQSRTTRENAEFTKRLLDSLNLGRVILVSHAIHMPRAVESFRTAGIDVVPAPTLLVKQREPQFMDWIPSPDAMSLSYRALHEYLGMLWYRLLGAGSPPAVVPSNV